MALRAPCWQLVVCALSAITALWFAAAATEVTARIIHQTLMRLGSELPALTAMVIAAVKLGVPWAAAIVGTLGLAGLVARANPCVLPACVLAAVVSAGMVSVAALALALPLSLCGDIWPDWTTVTGKPIPAVLCR